MTAFTPGDIKIIAGQFRGRKLESPPTDKVRPMLASMRETLCNILVSQRMLKGKRILDCFSGTGSIGIETLSREAREVVFVEMNVFIHSFLKRNVENFGLTEKSTILNAPIFAVMEEIYELAPFEVIVLDPPFRFLDPDAPKPKKNFDEPDRETFLARLADFFDSPKLLAPKAIAFVHHHKNYAPPELKSMELHKTRKFGINALTTYRKGFQDLNNNES